MIWGYLSASFRVLYHKKEKEKKKGYKCYHLPLEKMFVSMNVTLVEDQVYHLGGDSNASLKEEEKS